MDHVLSSWRRPFRGPRDKYLWHRPRAQALRLRSRCQMGNQHAPEFVRFRCGYVQPLSTL